MQANSSETRLAYFTCVVETADMEDAWPASHRLIWISIQFGSEVRASADIGLDFDPQGAYYPRRQFRCCPARA